MKTTDTGHQPPALDRDRQRKTASSITDPELDALYAQRDALQRLLVIVLVAGAAE
ncbi:hypothetical protein [Streptomyces sp. CAU 1734]|uniref:hypothetical protein n=1 Tax=Streptomyces sp. CAU 1734 TaxID=3140360 RepID=UPI00325FE899